MAQPTDEREIQRRRRVIRYSLNGVLSGVEIETALGLWEREFRSQPAFVVSSFVQRLAHHVDLGGRLKEIKNRLLGNMLLNEEDLGPEPLVSAPPPAQSPVPNPILAESSAADGSALDVVFNSVLQRAVVGIERQESSALRGLRAFLLEESGLSPSLSRSGRGCLLDWLGSTDRMRLALAPGCSEDEMKRILHVIYIWSCEEVGPSTADRIFSSAVRETESLPEAASFPPRHLF